MMIRESRRLSPADHKTILGPGRPAMTDNSTMQDDLAAAVLREVNEFHAFLADWFSGRTAADSGILAAQAQRFAADMQYISPTGGRVDAATIEQVLGEAHGSEPSIVIEIRNATVRRADAASVLVTYEEHQTGGVQDNSRLTTALFVAKADAPNGVGWFHVHEVWLVSN
jgi:hypothetical protein